MAGEQQHGSAFADWVGPSLLAMTRLARRLAPQADVDDVVQDALARAWRKRSTYDPARGTPTVWLLAIVADRARAARLARVRALRIVDHAAPMPDAATNDRVSDVDLDRAIGGLSERQQLAVQLHYYVGLSIDECAEVMVCSAGTVKSTLFDARAKMRQFLEVRDD